MSVGNMTTVANLLPKLQFLAQNRTLAEKYGYKNNWSGFSKRIAKLREEQGIDESYNDGFRNTLNSAAQNDRIDADTEAIIARMCDFDETGRAWLQGSRQKFEDSFSHEQFIVERKEQPKSLDRAISVQLFFRQDGSSSNWPFDIEVICQRASLPELGQFVVINRAEVSIRWDMKKFPETHASRAKGRIEFLNNQMDRLENDGIEVMVFGDDSAPRWELSHIERKKLGVVALDNICKLSGIKDGLSVTIALIVYDKDFCAKDTFPEITVETDDVESGELSAISRPDGAPLGDNKQKILQAIALRSMKQKLVQQQTGSLCFAQDSVSFKKR